jgi:hypothetical protein
VLGFEMSDDGLDGRSPSHLAFDLRRYASPLTRDGDPELLIRQRIVAAITFIDEEALDGIADELHLAPNWRSFRAIHHARPNRAIIPSIAMVSPVPSLG